MAEVTGRRLRAEEVRPMASNKPPTIKNQCALVIIRSVHCVFVFELRTALAHAPRFEVSAQPGLTRMALIYAVSYHAMTPNRPPTPAVKPMASAPQNVTLATPMLMRAPPAR